MEFLLKTSGGISLIGDIHEPDTSAQRIMILIHGLGDHYGRYSDWSRRFAKNGVLVLGVDLPGHGRSPGKRGHIQNYHIYNSIIESLAQYARSKYGDLPMGLYGHSLGGNIGLNYLLTNTYGFQFAIITSPWIKLVNDPPKATIAMAKIVNSFLPGLLQPNGLQLEHISRAEDVNEKYDSDPLVHDRVSIRLGLEALKAAERILETGSIIDIPVLILHGTDDKITSTLGSSLLAENNKNITLKLWDGGYHELQNEAFNDEVFDFMNNWLQKLK